MNTPTTKRLASNYLESLRAYLTDGPATDFRLAHEFGSEAVINGLEILALARSHDTACEALLPPDATPEMREELAARANGFFTEAILPIEKAHATAFDARVKLAQAADQLHQHTISRDSRQSVVLYVEDNLANLHLIEQILARCPGIDLLTAENAHDGIALAIGCVPDVILMDINLPGMSGIDAMRILNQNPVTAHIPIVALSANAMPLDVANGLSAGFFKYLTKPFNVIELMETLNFTLEFAANRDGAAMPAPTDEPLEAVI